jgi:hypothetical protein
MTTDPSNPQSREGNPVEADTNSALDTLFAEATKLMREMKSFLHRQREQARK